MTDLCRARDATRIIKNAGRISWKRVQAVFCDMRVLQAETNVIHYSAAISVLFGHWPLALAFLEHCSQDTVSFNAMLGVFAKNAMWQVALDMLCRQDSIDSAIDVDVVSYSTVVSACEKAGRWRAAMGVLALMSAKTTRPSLVTFSTILSSCGKAGEWAKGLTCLTEMRRQLSEPNLITLNSAITLCDRSFQWQAALFTASWLGCQSLNPDDITCRAAMSACQKAIIMSIAADVR